MTEFIEERTRIMGFAKLHSARELLGVQMSIEHYLIANRVCESCQTEATGNAECMLYISGESPNTIEIVAQRLDQTFNENIRFGGETTYQIECSENTVVLDFATCASQNLLVTGCIAIHCPHG